MSQAASKEAVDRKTSIPAVSAVPSVSSVPSAEIISSKWDVVISNAIVKTGLGFGAGILLSVLFFKKRSFPIWLGTGIGLGKAWSEGDSVFRGAGVRDVHA